MNTRNLFIILTLLSFPIFASEKKNESFEEAAVEESSIKSLRGRLSMGKPTNQNVCENVIAVLVTCNGTQYLIKLDKLITDEQKQHILQIMTEFDKTEVSISGKVRHQNKYLIFSHFDVPLEVSSTEAQYRER